ncbi:hypothetical protein FRC03_012035 [Tulasnella sp. 419]|nr:hypothetical protein FRC03_012035 [Tulasnella sp. 419]
MKQDSSHVPGEIWAIISTFLSKKEILSLMKVNRQLFNLNVENLYHTIDISHSHSRAVQLSHTLLSHSDLALLIKILRLPEPKQAKINGETEKALKKYERRRVELGKAQTVILARTKNLRELTVSLTVNSSLDSTTGRHTLFYLPELLSDLPLKSLVLRGRSWDSKALLSLITSNSKLSSSLTDLVISPWTAFDEGIASRSPHILPLIRTYDGPMIKGLVENLSSRGLSRVYIREDITRPTFDRLMLHLKRSSLVVPLEELELSLFQVPRIMPILFSHLPALRRLKIRALFFSPPSGEKDEYEGFLESIGEPARGLMHLEFLDLTGSGHWPSRGNSSLLWINQNGEHSTAVSDLPTLELWKDTHPALRAITLPNGTCWSYVGPVGNCSWTIKDSDAPCEGTEEHNLDTSDDAYSSSDSGTNVQKGRKHKGGKKGKKH